MVDDQKSDDAGGAPLVLENPFATATIGGRQLEYLVTHELERGITRDPNASMVELLTGMMNGIGACLTREDALIREVLQLRARVEALEATPVRDIDSGGTHTLRDFSDAVRNLKGGRDG